MHERPEAITMRGNPLTLLGPEIRIGQKAPDFSLVTNDMGAVTLADYAGLALALVSVPSLDTPVCAVETRRFNAEAAKLGAGVRILTISMDLPFAQKRWCGAMGIDKVETLSDHREASFGLNYGVLIKELRLLARAVFVVDKAGTVTYTELVKEVGDEPFYAGTLTALAQAAS
ncbi:thiol peroxidase (atypical 2-Cys peroxiredoxin) [Humidesulfovibrio mexicanus]|uniref:Thiol peroxidase n=1 Tax=Humidesulfovibrio mexicanus TaxID=147047 RepID=A0A239C5E3_9BACT|nr:thiol peroxidase [Humidesulfovibrio mexicanus]SNS15330.1 thiol peroxidase (atypical 2-Cys peroxiredoxin) [Humidesulfovibrio mexicanus]